MTYPGPSDPALREQWRRQRRAVVRRHHPDRGGDALAMSRRLDALDSHYRRLDLDVVPTAYASIDLAEAPPWQPATRVVRRARRDVRRLTRSARARIPVGWPGHRRQIDL